MNNVELLKQNNDDLLQSSSNISCTYTNSTILLRDTNINSSSSNLFSSSNLYSSTLNSISNINIFNSTSLNSSTINNIFPSAVSSIVNPDAATVHQCTDKWLNVLYQMRSSKLCSLTVSELNELEDHITNGISLPLDTEPQNIHFNNTTTVNENFSSVADRISEYISIGAVQQLSTSISTTPPLIQPLHVILDIKGKKKPRLVIDLSRNLNQLLPHTSFKYTSVQDAVRLSTHKCFYSKLDISNCFLSFPLHPNVYKYFVFQFDNKYYRFVRLPFGLSSAPRICTLLLSIIQFKLEQNNLILVRYLDDFLLISSSFQSASEHLSIAISIFQEFGLVVNNNKTEGPAQKISFLGIILDSVSRTLSISNERIDDMNKLLFYHFSLSTNTIVKVRDIMSFIGKLAFVSQVLPSARPFMRRLLDAIKGKRKQQRCRLPIEFKFDCAIWLQRIYKWNGLISWSISTQQPFVIISDASISGFGFYLHSFPASINLNDLPIAFHPNSAVSGTWHSSMSHLLSNRSIAYLELFSVVYALTMLGSLLHNHSVLILTDNESNVPIINKQRTRSAAIIGLLRSLAELSATHVFS